MRYIPLKKKEPNPDWILRANIVLNQLMTAPDVKARNAIIDKNRIVWSDLKEWLLSLSNQKCWFSEAKDCFSHWDVEHFRPKKSAKDVDGTEHDGYWWLAFDWQNLRICGNVGNRKKGTFFPLRVGCMRCVPLGDIRLEDQLLLDPADEHDPTLLSFNLEGRAVPAADLDDEWEKERVKYSVERYNLDFPPLMDKRKAIWNECWGRFQEYTKELALYYNDKTNMVAKNQCRQAASRVLELLHETQELSSVARACILSTGDLRAMALLKSA